MSETEVIDRSKFRFDGTVHLGHIFIILSFVVSSTVAYSAIRNEINNHEWRLVAMEQGVKEQRILNEDVRNNLSLISRDIAVMKTQMDRIEGKVKDR